ncbi:hypothetical protein N656DRAFT_846212 [Canariomyces notabilis]|uniref:Uncharacterized protein n=1 Tax=Canariomyces notabilis TaxID=2074819 RepID=A0AAN6TBT6_9PEZI|nr:hypothetical protein N656DRAFT_846212 [Canariomyces arenarius]
MTSRCFIPLEPPSRVETHPESSSVARPSSDTIHQLISGTNKLDLSTAASNKGSKEDRFAHDGDTNMHNPFWPPGHGPAYPAPELIAASTGYGYGFNQLPSFTQPAIQYQDHGNTNGILDFDHGNNVECNFQESYYGNDYIWPEGGHYGSEIEFPEEYYSSNSSDEDGYGGNCYHDESDHEYQADDEDEGPGQEEDSDDYDPDFDPSPGQFHDASEFTPDSNHAPYSDFEPSQQYDASDFYRSFMLPGMYFNLNSHDNNSGATTPTMSADAARELRAWFEIPTPDASSDETERSQAEDYNPNSDYGQQFYHVPASYPSVPVPPFYYNSAYNNAPTINNHRPTGPMMMMTMTPEAEADLRAWFDMPEADYVTTESDHDHGDDASS